MRGIRWARSRKGQIRFVKASLLHNDQLLILPIHTYQVSFRVVTLGTEHKLADEDVQEILKFGGVVRPVDNVAFILEIKLRLSAQLAAKEFARVCWGSTQCFADLRHVCNNSLNSIAFTLDLSKSNQREINL